jgi:thiamine phosphate synthase YjbQ (UPF0047 family)
MQDRCAHAIAPRTFSSKALKRPSEVLSEIAPRGSHQRHSRGHQRSSARSHLEVLIKGTQVAIRGPQRDRTSRFSSKALKSQSEVISEIAPRGSHQRHSRGNQRSSARSHLEVLIKGTQEAIRGPQRDRTSRFSSKALKRPSEVLSEIAPRGSRASAYRRRAAWRPMRPPPPPSSRLPALTKLRSRLAELTKLRSRLAELTKLPCWTRQWRARRRHVPTPPRAAGRRAR